MKNKTDVANEWLKELERSLTGDLDVLDSLFQEDAGWRDLLAFTWDVRQAHNLTEMKVLLSDVLTDIAPHAFVLDPSKPSPESNAAPGDVSFEVFFKFNTAAGTADGYSVLVADENSRLGFICEKIFTRLNGLHEHQSTWPKWGRFDKEHPDQRWSEHRVERASFENRDPEVLIVGGGQFGVMTAAYLERLGVDSLIVDKQPRVGDAWRSRYESLILHQPHGILYFPFMRFPESFPEYIPKDKMADWFESYVDALDLNFWTSTEFMGGQFDEASKQWSVTIKQKDGSLRTMRPKHVIVATGGSNVPIIPDIAGASEFQGEAKHAAYVNSGRDYAGQNVLIIGCGTTAHDLALDIAKSGGKATMLQRSPLVVIDLPTANTLYGDYNARKVPTELVDTRFMAGGIYPKLMNGFTEFTKWSDQADSKLHEGLRKAGMQVWSGEADAGFYYAYLKTQGGYYINVGASEAIIDGRIGVLQTTDTVGLCKNGLQLKNGETVQFDSVIYATAHKPMISLIERFFGENVVAKLGDVWGFDADGEMRNIAKPTAQEGLWIMAGSIPMARWYSPIVALRIKAQLAGIVPPKFSTLQRFERGIN